MENEPVELFYAYTREDESLRKELEKHLKTLTRQGIIRGWHEQLVAPGGLWEQEVSTHLTTAQIILLLVSPDFVASDYCYGSAVQQAMQRHATGTAQVIPILLRTCDWQHTCFGGLQALPRNGKPVTMWARRDAAFTEIAQELRALITGPSSEDTTAQGGAANTKRTTRGEGTGSKTMAERSSKTTTRKVAETPEQLITRPGSATPGTTALKKAVDTYYKELDSYKGKADYELAVRSAFQNLLATTARNVGWTLIPEQTLPNGARPDGTLRDDYFARGYWEAKGPDKDLEREIKDKIKKGYPLTNTIFENTRRAVLFQNKQPVFVIDDMSRANAGKVQDMLRQFLTYSEPDIENFEAAVQEFKERIPELAQSLLTIIEKEHKENSRFITAFNTFADLCRASLDPNISTQTLNEMLVQHLLTERLFRTVFDNPDFITKNVIAAEIEKVVQALASRKFNRNEFLKALDRFYVAIEAAAKGIENWSERQDFLNTVYERFFQGFAIKKADTHGIVYTPQEIVDFMCASVEEVLQKEFGRSISEPGVQILDPATGTGNFIVNLIRNHINRRDLKHKYQHDLFCNEIMLLPYYIASLNIEHEYYEAMREYEPFEGICFADTLELAENQQLSLFVEENTERVRKEKKAEIMVVIGNPPYNVGQVNENDNNKNRKYPLIDQRIRETYAKASKASNKNALSDAYVKFFRWATDRLQGRDGIVCLVTNNSFVDQIAFDGMRMYLQKDFTQIYHLDLHGNVRKNPKLSGTTHNVFGIQVGVGITIAVRKSGSSNRKLSYYRVPEYWRKEEKLDFLREKINFVNIDWHVLQPDEKYTWITEGMQKNFSTFIPLGTKDAKTSVENTVPVIFKAYSSGVKTNRDTWTYDFNFDALSKKIKVFIETYRSDLDRWQRRGNSSISIDDFVTYDDTRIKWSESLKSSLQRAQYTEFNNVKIRRSIYRPFCKQWLFFDQLLNERVYQFPQIFPTSDSEINNVVICATGIGADHQTFFASNVIVDAKCGITGNSTVQCFPFYTYAPDGSHRRENITDWVLKQFQNKYGEQVTKWDIFHYVYAILHHPSYRERYAENLKRDLPHIPLLATREGFESCVRIGKHLMEMHVGYEQWPEERRVEWLEDRDVPFSLRVEKMRLSADRRVVVVNESLRLGPIPEECFEYKLGNRSALEWVLDQYQVSEDKRSGIVSDPNRVGSREDEEYIVRLVGRVVAVSVETVRLVRELAAAVQVEDWLGDTGV